MLLTQTRGQPIALAIRLGSSRPAIQKAVPRKATNLRKDQARNLQVEPPHPRVRRAKERPGPSLPRPRLAARAAAVVAAAASATAAFLHSRATATAAARLAAI